jgi:hypothetical protein
MRPHAGTPDIGIAWRHIINRKNNASISALELLVRCRRHNVLTLQIDERGKKP